MSTSWRVFVHDRWRIDVGVRRKRVIFCRLVPPPVMSRRAKWDQSPEDPVERARAAAAALAEQLLASVKPAAGTRRCCWQAHRSCCACALAGIGGAAVLHATPRAARCGGRARLLRIPRGARVSHVCFAHTLTHTHSLSLSLSLSLS